MTIEKKPLKTKPVCKVKFLLSGRPYDAATSVTLVGDFNDWSTDQTPFKKDKDGNWSVSLNLDSQKEHQFRYLIDGAYWENEPGADKFIPNGLSSENSVLVL
jgi:1,4-alpha-glucan branching enzyme